MHELEQAVAANLRAEIKRRGLTVVKIAPATENSADYLRRKLRGERPLSLRDVLLIAEALDLDAEEFMPSNQRRLPRAS